LLFAFIASPWPARAGAGRSECVGVGTWIRAGFSLTGNFPKSLKDGTDTAWNLAIKTKSSVFSPQLALALKEDSAAQAKAEGEIVGLDFDPFLNSQDPWPAL
jgi:hypothetical protein